MNPVRNIVSKGDKFIKLIFTSNGMNNERYTQVIGSLFLAVVLFAFGFYFGNKNSTEITGVQFLNATTTESVDLAPFWKAWKTLDEKFVGVSSTTKAVSGQDKMWGAIGGAIPLMVILIMKMVNG